MGPVFPPAQGEDGVLLATDTGGLMVNLRTRVVSVSLALSNYECY